MFRDLKNNLFYIRYTKNEDGKYVDPKLFKSGFKGIKYFIKTDIVIDVPLDLTDENVDEGVIHNLEDMIQALTNGIGVEYYEIDIGYHYYVQKIQVYVTEFYYNDDNHPIKPAIIVNSLNEKDKYIAENRFYPRVLERRITDLVETSNNTFMEQVNFLGTQGNYVSTDFDDDFIIVYRMISKKKFFPNHDKPRVSLTFINCTFEKRTGECSFNNVNGLFYLSKFSGSCSFSNISVWFELADFVLSEISVSKKLGYQREYTPVILNANTNLRNSLDKIYKFALICSKLSLVNTFEYENDYLEYYDTLEPDEPGAFILDILEPLHIASKIILLEAKEWPYTKVDVDKRIASIIQQLHPSMDMNIISLKQFDLEKELGNIQSMLPPQQEKETK